MINGGGDKWHHVTLILHTPLHTDTHQQPPQSVAAFRERLVKARLIQGIIDNFLISYETSGKFTFTEECNYNEECIQGYYDVIRGYYDVITGYNSLKVTNESENCRDEREVLAVVNKYDYDVIVHH